jgi:uncharacterized protein (TIGR02118 family)
VKLVFCCRRRPGLSLEEFQATWLDDHGPLVRRLRAQIPGMRRYVQSHTIAGPVTDALRASRGSAEPYDGVTEVWFDSLEDLGGSGEEAREAGNRLLEDERRFLDLARCSVFVTTEHEIF